MQTTTTVNHSVSGSPGNCTVFSEDELARYLLEKGDLTLTLATRRLLPLSITYVLIFVTGLIGNIVNCIVIMNNRAMHTTTNFYLLNLSCSDLLSLILGLPFELWGFFHAYPWLFGEWFCILRAAAAETTTTVSIFTITAFTIERYVAVSRPIHARTSSKLKRVARVLVGIWIVSLLVGGVLATQFGVIYLRDSQECEIQQSALCGLRQDRIISHSFEIGSTLFVVPMVVIIVFCTLIALSLRRVEKMRSAANEVPFEDGTKRLCNFSEHVSAVSEKKCSTFQPAFVECATPSKPEKVQLRISYSGSTTQTKLSVNKMLFAVCAAFFICFAPFHISRVLLYIGAANSIATPIFQEISDFVYFMAGSFYYLNATVNPIIYNVMSKNFRRAFTRQLCRCMGQMESKNSTSNFGLRSTCDETLSSRP